LGDLGSRQDLAELIYYQREELVRFSVRPSQANGVLNLPHTDGHRF
jgi:hypothetical protein